MNKTFTTIDPSLLQIGPEAPFRYRRFLPGEADTGPRPENEALVESIGRYGLLHPPLLLEEPGDGPPAVVCGHRRVAAACIAGVESIDAISLDAPIEEVIPLWLEDASFGAPLSDLELVVLITRCQALSGQGLEGAKEQLSCVAGRNLTFDHMERMERLLELPDDILEALHEGRLSTGDLLFLMESRAINAIRTARLLAGAALKRSERREAVRLLLRTGDLGIWREFEEARDELEDGETLKKQEGGLLPALRAACNPSLERDLGRIDEIMTRLRLPPGASLRPPENLEGGGYRLSARIRDERGLEELLEKLRAALERGDIGQLLGILKGNV
jgi:ParB-like chromosome segregation protein Spo0J